MTHDIAVIGGGPAGATAALAAADAGARVLLLHAGLAPQRPVLERVAPRALRLLERLGVAVDATAAAACAARECPGVRSRWGVDAPVHTARSIWDPWGGGWVVPRARFDAWLRTQAQARGAQLLAARATGLARTPQGGWGIELCTARGARRQLQARQLVLAAGRASRRLLRSLGSKTCCAARELAVMARVSGVAAGWAQDPVLLVESGAQGWGYGLAAPRRQALVGFVVPGSLAAEGGGGIGVEGGLARTEALWHRALATSGMLREAAGQAALRQLWVQPCPLVRAVHMGGPGWVVAGDAGCTHSPLSGQGVCFAVESGWRAAAALMDGPDALAAQAQWMAQAAEEHLATWSAMMARVDEGA